MLAHEGLDHADGDEVFLNVGVHCVELFLHEVKQLVDHVHQRQNGAQQNRDGAKIDKPQLPVVAHHDHNAHDHLKRRGDKCAQHHLDGGLKCADIAGGAGDKACGGETVNVRKGEVLNVVEQRLAQIGAEAVGAACGVPGGKPAGHGAYERKSHHDQPVAEDDGLVTRSHANVHNVGHERGQCERDDRFKQHKKRRQKQGQLIAAPIACVNFLHAKTPIENRRCGIRRPQQNLEMPKHFYGTE